MEMLDEDLFQEYELFHFAQWKLMGEICASTCIRQVDPLSFSFSLHGRHSE